MRIATKRRLGFWSMAFAVVVASLFGRTHLSAAQEAAGGGNDVTVVDAGAGPCTADFVVRDATGKSVYDAKINIQLKYGFLGTHRVGAMVGTSPTGKARIEGLPDRIKGTAEFTISHGNLSKTVAYDPLDNCHPQHEVTLTEK